MQELINLSDPIPSVTNHLSAPSSKSNSYDPDDWRLMIRRTKQFALILNEANISTILSNAPEFKDKIVQDVFSKTTMIKGPMPWKRINTPIWQDEDNLQFLGWLQQRGMTKLKLEIVQKGVKLAALANQINPVVDYLKSLSWDETPRLENWLTTYMNVEPTSYTKIIAPKVLISAVARALQPGVKVDTMLVLEGGQGTGKSTAIRVLFGEDYHTDQLPSPYKHQEAGIQVQGKWVVEVAELRGLKNSSADMTKAFLTQNNDEFRSPYAVDKIKHPRSCIFIGTTNDDVYLKDPTGGRRFWSVKCGNANLERLAADRDQLWAEAVHRYQSGEPWHLTPGEDQLAQAEQEDRYEEDPWAPLIDAIMEAVTSENIDKLKSKVPDWTTLSPDLKQGKLTPGQVAQIMDIPTPQHTQDTFKRIANHLRHRTWFMKKSGYKWYHPSHEWLQKQEAKSKELNTTEKIEAFANLFSEPSSRDGIPLKEEPTKSVEEQKLNLNPEDYDPKDFPDHFTIDDIPLDEHEEIKEQILLTEQQEADIFFSANMLQSLMKNRG